MSVQAMAWVLDGAPDLPAHLVGTLMAIANAADSGGHNAWPSQETIGRQARKTVRAVRKDLAQLELLGLIRRGDQRIVMHIRPDRRPVVWDIPLSATAGTAVPAGTSRPVVGGRTTGTTVPTTRHEPINPPHPPQAGGAACRHRRPRPGCPACEDRMCDTSSEPHSDACRRGQGRECRLTWCACRCHQRRTA